MRDPRPPSYVSGLDLGQASDFTALACLEKRMLPDPARDGRPVGHYAVRHLERFKLGTPYPAIIEQLRERFGVPPLERTVITVDRTGVGRAVYDMLLAARLPASLVPVTITAGHTTERDDQGGWRTAKKDLVSCLQVLLQTRRLAIPPTLAEAQTLAAELQNFRVKITAAANETFESWRDNQHDDLVLAVALAAWMGERTSPAGGWLVPRESNLSNLRGWPMLGLGR